MGAQLSCGVDERHPIVGERPVGSSASEGGGGIESPGAMVEEAGTVAPGPLPEGSRDLSSPCVTLA